MTRSRRRARRIRRVILVAGLVCTACAVGWLILPLFNGLLFEDFRGAGLLGTPFLMGDPDEWEYAINVAFFVGLVLLAQWAFLRPRRGWPAQLAATGRPLRSAVFAAAAMGMLLTVGLVAILLEMIDWWEPIFEGGVPSLLAFWGAMLLIWGVWAWIFFVYWRQGDRYTQLGKVLRGLIAGSLVEAFVAVPVFVAADRQQQGCYCRLGTYTTLVFAGTVLLWAFGPGIVLLYMRDRYRRERLFPTCASCGYDLRASRNVCPECGTPVPEGQAFTKL